MRNRAASVLLPVLLAGPAHALKAPAGDLWCGLESRMREAPALSSPAPVRGEPAVVESSGAAVVTEDRLFERLAAADVVYVGEQHDQAAHHLVQRAVLEGLRVRKKGLALGLEMVDISQQKALDDYSSGAMSDESFAEFWKKAWGFDFAIYKPVLSYARDNGIPIVALNAPSAIVRQVAKGGLASLSLEQKAQIPDPIEPIKDPRYLAYVKASLGGHGQLPPEREARMLEAMQVWNETMGRSAREAAGRYGSLMVIAGSGHMLYRGGIAECVASHSGLRQEVVLPYPLDGESQSLQELLKRLQDPGSEDLPLADWFWLLPAAQPSK